MTMRSLAHEVGTSLQGILSYAGLIEPSMSPGEIAEHLAIIQENALRIAGVMEDLRHQNELDAGRQRLENEEVDLRQALEQVAYGLTLRHPQRTFDYRVDPNSTNMKGDAAHIRYVFGAVARFVIRMSAEGSDVHFTASGDENYVRVGVTASDARLPDEDRGLAFAKFAALAEDGKAHKEVGLGLHAAREVVRLMGGDIELREGANGTTGVQVVLPGSLSF
jgi:signal transduction histidine kinase